jgi:hypothetical protein
MPDIRFHVVDVVASAPFNGFQLVVCLDPCGEDTGRDLSLEFNLGVSTPQLTGERRYRTRFFENGHQLPFGGVPTLRYGVRPRTRRVDAGSLIRFGFFSSGAPLCAEYWAKLSTESSRVRPLKGSQWERNRVVDPSRPATLSTHRRVELEG